jgi:hypothetical protein
MANSLALAGREQRILGHFAEMLAVTRGEGPSNMVDLDDDVSSPYIAVDVVEGTSVSGDLADFARPPLRQFPHALTPTMVSLPHVGAEE